MRVTRKQAGTPRPACPACGATAAARPLMFGFPSEEMFEASERGEIILGGCCLPEGPLPHWRCEECRAEFE